MHLKLLMVSDTGLVTALAASVIASMHIAIGNTWISGVEIIRQAGSCVAMTVSARTG